MSQTLLTKSAHTLFDSNSSLRTKFLRYFVQYYPGVTSVTDLSKTLSDSSLVVSTAIRSVKQKELRKVDLKERLKGRLKGHLKVNAKADSKAPLLESKTVP